MPSILAAAIVLCLWPGQSLADPVSATTRLATAPAAHLAAATSTGPATTSTAPAATAPDDAAPDRPSLVQFHATAVIRQSILGEWTAALGSGRMRLFLRADGSFALDGRTGQFSVEGSRLTLASEGSSVGYRIQIDANNLTLSEGGLETPIKFERVPEAGNFLAWLFDFSPRQASITLYRVLIIVGIAIVGVIVLRTMRLMFRLAIYSNVGPFKYLYRTQKNRTMTVYSLGLNLAKYVVYFSAFGFILSEIGVNYTTYLASLSVIGLAIGFGSQGLVQDMVTGFFVILEGQFDVGDMVEIGNQTGTVEELGLRATTLRNYFGQNVVIPNRNIAVVGNFVGGGQQATIDVPLATAELCPRAAGLVQQVALELSGQYHGVVLSGPQISGPMSPVAGEHFVRLTLTIWPQQQWLIDNELLPRIKASLAAANVAMPQRPISVFYHLPEQHETATWVEPLRKIGKRLDLTRFRR